MHLAVATTDMDIETWLATNTAYCLRYQARLSMAACGQNRGRSGGDCRCEGCGGLYDQPPPVLALRLVSPARYANENEPDRAILPVDVEDPQGEFPNADQIEDESDTLALLADFEVELAEEQLGDLCPGLSGEIGELLAEDTAQMDEEVLSERREKKPRRRKVAVFMGRCHRCSGYMVNDRERQFGETDEELYRCFSCGWRISPIYAFNRATPVKAQIKAK
jgi:hypothetical protein